MRGMAFWADGSYRAGSSGPADSSIVLVEPQPNPKHTPLRAEKERIRVAKRMRMSRNMG